jgi:chaperonin GroEL
MAKQIIYGEQSRQAILRGVNALADVVKDLGPRAATWFWTRSSAPHHHQGRRDGGQENDLKDAREHGRADGARGGEQDVGHGR